MRWTQLLNESVKKYEQMFSIFKVDGRFPPWVADRIRKVEELVQNREDRTVWALRWERYLALGRHPVVVDKQAATNKFARDLGTVNQAEIETYEKLMNERFQHLFSLNIAKMNSYVFDRQAPDQIWRDLYEIEEEWKATRKQIINHDSVYPHREIEDDEEEEWDGYADDDEDENEKRQAKLEKQGNIEKIIDFGNGWAWWDLHRTHCTTEGNAMGHCGNAPSAQIGHTVLSLRQDMGNGNFRPSLTFIFNEDTGMLGEMKGRANEKPAERYHAMICKLLLDPRVDGCEGGGYEAKNNFTVLDLPEETRMALLRVKPALLSTIDRISLYKADPSDENRASIINAVKKSLRHYGFSFKEIDTSNPDRLMIVINKWDNIRYFARSGQIYKTEMMDDFFNELPELLTHYCDREEAENISTNATQRNYNEVLRGLMQYPDANFMLSGVDYEIKGQSVILGVSVMDYLNPSTDYYDEDDNRPLLDTMRELEQTTYESDPDWSDVSDNFPDLSEIGLEIAKYCFGTGRTREQDKINLAKLIYDEANGDNIHYHSDSTDQYDLDLGEE
jgi:hypothetical protein